MKHTTIGLYRDGTFKVNGVESEHLNAHIEYNKTMRFGRALFVDGECVHTGYMTEKECSDFIQGDGANIKMSKCTAPYR